MARQLKASLGRFAGKAWRSARAVDHPALRVLAMLAVAWWIALAATAMAAIYIGLIPLLVLWWILKTLLDDPWSKWPTLEEYWLKYPHCRTNRGTRCYYCGSGNIWQQGWSSRSDERRIHRCNQCRRDLYRM